MNPTNPTNPTDPTLPAPVVGLITDFGLQDEYVGVMKAVILSVNPLARIVDVCHAIEPQNIEQAGHMLASVTPYFPAGAVLVVVVDPGVGGERRILAARRKGIILLAPDNGLLSVWGDVWEAGDMVQVQNPKYFLPRISRSFHGRDIFAPVAGHLTLGVSVQALGPVVDPSRIRRIEIQQPRIDSKGTVRGTVVAVDRFGNLITNISGELLAKAERGTPESELVIELPGHRIHGCRSHYGAVDIGRPLALISSRDTLEIAVNGGSAAAFFTSGTGTPVHVHTAE